MGRFLAGGSSLERRPELRKEENCSNSLGPETSAKSGRPGRYAVKLKSVMKSDNCKLILNSACLGN